MNVDDKPHLDWEHIASRFESYAHDEGAKVAAESRETLRKNRQRLMSKAFRPLLPVLSAVSRIADVGCGSGDLLLFLRPRTAARLTGFDPSLSQIEVSRSRLQGMSGIELVSDPAALRGPYDMVFSLHVIEHVQDTDLPEFAAFVSGLIGPEGKIVIATPNGLNPLAYSFYMSSDRTHVRMHSAFTLNELFRPFGLEVQQIHREMPQIYDLPTLAKTAVWWCSSLLLKVGVYSTAAGIRGLRFPLSMAPSLYYGIGRGEGPARL